MKAFQKDELATLIGDWDSKGTVFIRQVRVHSCGRKQMVLHDAATGEFIGHNFPPVVGIARMVGREWLAHAVFKLLNAEDAERVALDFAERVLAVQREHFAACIARWPDDVRYVAAIRGDIDALHEPRIHWLT